MKILVVSYLPLLSDRKTIDEHLYSFKRYSDAKCFYLNVFLGVPGYLNKIKFDLVIYHYTYLSLKWGGDEFFNNILKECEVLKSVSGYKVALPQDEYVHSDKLCHFFKEYNVDKLYTCFYKNDWDKVYPKHLTGLKELETTLTGFVDENSKNNLSGKAKPHKDRKFDIGYRARKLPFWLGEHGTIKWKITEAFLKEAPKYPHLNMNISNSEKDVFIGNSWNEFLMDCRIVLGCEGGASLLDTNGSIRKKVDDYVKDHPEATFEQVRDLCFPDMDNNIELFAISPRHFDACLTKTCQVLIEGNYHGIFKPDVHYIPLKKDFSNIKDVLDKIQDIDYCEKIAERAYQDIILSNTYTYSNFVNSVLSVVSSRKEKESLLELCTWNLVHCNYVAVRVMKVVNKRIIYTAKRFVWQTLKDLGLLPYAKALMGKKTS